jgi:hypothetical protein
VVEPVAELDLAVLPGPVVELDAAACSELVAEPEADFFFLKKAFCFGMLPL